jgi:head-tail adaptor
MALARLSSGPVDVGQLSERIDVWTDQAVPMPVASLTQALGLATAETVAPHGFNDGDYVRIGGALEPGYNGEHAIALVDATTFDFHVEPTTPTPATPGPEGITATFTSDAQGGQSPGWRLYLPGLFASVTGIAGDEVLTAEAIQAIVRYRVELRYRTDLSVKMRLRWYQYGHPPGRLLEILTLRPHPDAPRARLLLACGEVAS